VGRKIATLCDELKAFHFHLQQHGRRCYWSGVARPRRLASSRFGAQRETRMRRWSANWASARLTTNGKTSRVMPGGFNNIFDGIAEDGPPPFSLQRPSVRPRPGIAGRWAGPRGAELVVSISRIDVAEC
jgi:hypothetical protein